MLSLKTGRPIALIKSISRKKNKLDNELVFIDENKEGRKEIVLPKGYVFEPVPDVNRSVSYVAGPSGSGKSTYASKFMKNFKKIFKGSNIIVFSRLDTDEVIDKLKPIRIKIDEELVEDPIDIFEEFHNNDLVLFDDCDTIQNKSIRDAVSKIQNDILETGRHKNIFILVTSHLINGNDRKNCRTLLNESNTITFFPKSGSTYQIKYLLKNYIGLSNNQINDILNMKSRWITIGKTYPQYIMGETFIYLI